MREIFLLEFRTWGSECLCVEDTRLSWRSSQVRGVARQLWWSERSLVPRENRCGRRQDWAMV